MVTLPEDITPDAAPERIEEVARVVIGGHKQAAIRRLILWAVLFVSIPLGLPVVTIGAAALLFGTDDLA